MTSMDRFPVPRPNQLCSGFDDLVFCIFQAWLVLANRIRLFSYQSFRVRRYDANISLPGCDKNMPGTLMAMARLNRPSIMIYGGTIQPGKSKLDGSTLDIVSAFQSYGEFLPLFLFPCFSITWRHMGQAHYLCLCRLAW